jgi:hypothetical protein
MTLSWVLIGDLPGEERTLVRLTGPDTDRFLQGTLSGDIDEMDAKQALPAALLTVKGKLVSDCVVLRLGDEELGLVVPSELAQSVYALLDKHIIMDEVEVAIDPAQAFVVAWGEDAAGLSIDGASSFETTHPAPGNLIMGDAEVLAAGLPKDGRADAQQWTAHRIETASPAWGRELTNDRFPPEAGFVHGVSYDKGCFLGQEPLSRIHTRSQVNWVLVQVEGSQAPSGPAPLSHPDRDNAGQWTTWTADGSRGLAIVRRNLAVEGTQLSAGDSGGVTVSSGPLGDDPGART